MFLSILISQNLRYFLFLKLIMLASSISWAFGYARDPFYFRTCKVLLAVRPYKM
jgi:hypothetical protein